MKKIVTCLLIMSLVMLGVTASNQAYAGNKQVADVQQKFEVYLMDSSNQPIESAKVHYIANGRKYTNGKTNENGFFEGTVGSKIESVIVRVFCNNTTQELKQNITTNHVFEFQTNKVDLELRDSKGDPINEGVAKFNTTGIWYSFGKVSNGIVTKELLPGDTRFRMIYADDLEEREVRITTDTTITFNTVNVELVVKDSNGDTVDGKAKYKDSHYYKYFGKVTDGSASKEMLINSSFLKDFRIDNKPTKIKTITLEVEIE